MGAVGVKARTHRDDVVFASSYRTFRAVRGFVVRGDQRCLQFEVRERGFEFMAALVIHADSVQNNAMLAPELNSVAQRC